MVFIVILAILLALIAVLLIVLVVRMGRSSRGEPPAGARRAGEAPSTTGAEETPTREVPTGLEGAPPGEPPPTR